MARGAPHRAVMGINKAALHLKAHGMPQAVEQAAQLFAGMTQQEPEFAPTHSELALSMVHRASRHGLDRERCEERARQAVDQARQRAPDLAETRADVLACRSCQGTLVGAAPKILSRNLGVRQLPD